jgi:ATP-dependent DNA helicase DinG
MSVSSHQLIALAREAVAEELKEKSGVEGLVEAAQALEKATADFRLALGREPRREAWEALVRMKAAREALSALEERLADLTARLAPAAGKGEGLANAHGRALGLLERLGSMGDSPPPEYVAWFETTARAFTLHLSPLTIAETFRQHAALPAQAGGRKAWIFTSATLAIDRRFDHFQARLGLEEAETGLWESPFDYARQTLLYLPEGLPEPSAEDYTERVIEIALPVLEASRGRAFLLFTSHRALRIAAERLAGRLDYPLLVQGEAPRSALLARFRALGNAVLLGTASFWEGVDVRGEALSCVIIDKLPFAAPDDPVLKARCRALEEAGGRPFLDYQLPEAVIALKQGVGRLIRDEADRGVLVLCDPRLLTRGYGRVFLDSLPPMPRTRELDDVRRFFATA